MKRLTTACALAAALLCGTAFAEDIASDMTIDSSNVSTYANKSLNVAAGATLTIALAPSSDDQAFSGAVSGAGKIVVANTGAKVVRFTGSFASFTGALTATGDVRIGSMWTASELNGSLTGLTCVQGAASKTIKFFGANVFGENGEALNPGHQSGSYSTIDLNGFDQTISLLTFMGCAYDESSSSYKKPTYTLTSATPAVLTVRNGFCWATTSGPYPKDHSGVVKVNGALSLVFAGDADSSFAFHGDSATTGGLTVQSGEIVLASDATFNGLTSLAATGSGTLTLETSAVNSQNLALSIANSGKVALPSVETFRVKTLTVDGAAIAPDEYSAEEIATLTGNRLTGAAVEVLSREIGETTTFTWTGGGADDSLATAANWQGGAAPSLTGGDEVLVFASGTSATIPAGADVYGIEITTASDFTLRGEMFRLGAGGLTCGETEAVRTCRFEAAPRTAGEQTWCIPANTVVELAAGWAGHSAVTLERTTGTGDILKFAADETPSFAGSLSVPNGSKVVLAGRGGIGASGSQVTLNGQAGVRVDGVTCVTNDAAITFGHGPALNELAPAGVTFVQRGKVTNAASGANSSSITVAGELRLAGGVCESDTHKNSPTSYKYWSISFNMGDTGSLMVDGQPVSAGTCAVRLQRGTARLCATGNAYGTLALLQGVQAVCGCADALAAEGNVGFGSGWPGSLDLNGFDQTAANAIACDDYGYANDSPSYSAMYVTSATAATLKLTGAGTYAPNNLNFRGAASLHYAGTGRLAMTNTASTTTGSLTVSGGEVALLAGATWANCTNVVVSGSGKLALDARVAEAGAFSREATFSVSGDGTIEIPAGETVVVKYLYRDGEPTFSGSYADGFVTGGGTLRVRKSSKDSGFLLIVR